MIFRTTLIVTILAAAGQLWAQQNSASETPATRRPILDALDGVRRDLLGGLLPTEQPPKKPEQPATAERKTNGTPTTPPQRMTPAAPNARPVSGATTTGAGATAARSTPARGESDEAESKPIKRAAEPANPAQRPLHERIAAFGKSTFDTPADDEQDKATRPRVDRSATAPAEPARGDRPAIAAPPAGTAKALARPIAPAASPIRSPSDTTRTPEPIPSQRAGIGPRATTERVSAKPAEAEPVIEEPTPAKPPVDVATPAKPPVQVATPAKPPIDALGPAARKATTGRSSDDLAARPGLGRGSAAPMATPAPAAAPREQVLIARRSPALSVETFGPRRITVGRESTYQLVLNNASDVTAEEPVVSITLPRWAEVLGMDATAGTPQLSTAPDGSHPLQWKLPQLAGNGKERLTLRIIPRENKPIDLAVRWDYRPTASQALIEVQEAKLALQLEGPREVLYGRKQTLTLHVANQGNGDAENVAVILMPVAPSDEQPTTHRIGTLAAGEDKTFELDLMPKQTGTLAIQIDARAEGGLQARLSEKLLVRRGALAIDVSGPQVQFVGAVAAYRVRVANTGNAPARSLKFTATLPAGAKYISGVDGATLDNSGAQLSWRVESLAAGAEQIFAVRCSPGLPGANRIEVACAADDDLAVSGAATTRIETVADLTLEVRDPVGPIAVGEEAIYELHVLNRGTKAAETIDVAAFFSNGIEPVASEGGEHTIQPGQVIFKALPAIAPGGETVLKVKARAQAPGMHTFRTEVHCRALGARLVSEKTTHFYQDGGAVAGEPNRVGPRK